MNLSSILTFLKKDNFRYLHIGIIVSAILCLLVAYIVEIILHIKPCPLCIYQRFPFLYLIKLSASALLISRFSRKILYPIMFTLVIACLLAGYHAGIERKIFEISSFCTTQIHIPKHFNLKEIKNIISDTPLSSCSDTGFKFLGLSMSEYNLLFNFSLLILVITLMVIK